MDSHHSAKDHSHHHLPQADPKLGSGFSTAPIKVDGNHSMMHHATQPMTNGHHDAVTVQPVKKGPCCVCKETKTVRDECVRVNGLDKCSTEINAHNACLKKEGFNIL